MAAEIDISFFFSIHARSMKDNFEKKVFVALGNSFYFLVAFIAPRFSELFSLRQSRD